MLPKPVIDRQVPGPPAVAFIEVLERHPVKPFQADDLNEMRLGEAV